MPAAVLWPARESLYDLMRLRASIGDAAFAAEKQCDPHDPTLAEWPPDYFDHPSLYFDQWPEKLEVRTLALDPSKGKDAKTGDYSAYVRFGRDQYGVEYVEADLARRTTDVMVAEGVEHVRAFKPDGFAVEANQFQELLCTEFRRVFSEAKVDVAVHPIDNTVNKLVRIRRLGPSLAQRRIRFKSRSPGTALLVQQLRDFPQGDHDDGPDACELARRLAVQLFNRAAMGRGSSRYRA